MRYSDEQAAAVLNEVVNITSLAQPDELKVRLVNYNMSYLRATFLASAVRNTIGGRVFSGPFKGMQLTRSVMQGAFGPALLGTYEHELHPVVEHIIATPYKHILNIGCAYGYYSVGLAMRMPQVKIHSFDIDEGCRAKCLEMAALNNVQPRVEIAGEFRGEDFAAYANEKTLVIMDIEGAEKELLDPAKYPALQKMDVLVELHDVFVPAISDTVAARFLPTHDVEIIRNKPVLFDFESLGVKIPYVDPFDTLLITWEARDGATPWGVFRAKNQ